MSWYYNYKNKPTIETDEGIKAKSKRGAFVKSWWATRWIEAMEQLMDRGRLQRGRRYARKGQVVSLTEGTGEVVGKVQGSRKRPYKITIQIKPLTDTQWEQIIEALAARPIFMAQLLAGEMPQEIEEAFVDVNLSLFPTVRDLTQDCNCPDWAEVCKHLAAVQYILAERFDEDPFLLFRLRGKTQDEILVALRKLQGVGGVEETSVPEYDPPPPLSDSLNDFWGIGEEIAHFQTQIDAPESPYPALARLGAPPFMENIERWLKPAYDEMSETAVSTAFTDQEQPNENEDKIAP
ncbi:hypothetical protein MNBD_CHLOROFLEXI01-3079 [hydrothermal vent metagenome]|uniref:SWIM-type domain-containing protein n=1 Tax=hydrothermal vent metagenome TaxID=652676 RepID=A0A3B0UPS1_9ZZZZ